MNKVYAIKNRHSVRKYQLKQIEQEKIDKLNVMKMGSSISNLSGMRVRFTTGE